MKKTALISLALAWAAVPGTALARPVELEVQMGTYMGEEAFFAVYLVAADGRYAQTLWVSGRDRAYYADMSRWWKYLGRQPQDLDAITGASTGSGDDAVLTLEIDEALINTGHVIRIESAVEELNVYAEDAIVPLSDESRGQKIAGTGYIRFVTLNY